MPRRYDSGLSTCPNCLAPLEGEYCARCGQRRIHPDDLSARRFFRDLADEIADFPARLKSLRTLRRLVLPGLLTSEYLAGRREPYLSPFKFYVLCAAIFFLLAPVTGFTLASMLQSDRSGVLNDLVATRLAERRIDPAVFNARFDARVQSIFTLALGATSLVLALTLQLLFRKRHWPYGAHLVFAIHYISFMYFVTLAAGLAHVLGVSIDVAVIAGYVLLFLYLALALKRVYAEPMVATLGKTAVLVLLVLVLNRAADTVAIRLTLALV